LKLSRSIQLEYLRLKTEEAFSWLRENGHGDLIKNQVTMEFGMKQDNEAKSIVEELKQKRTTSSAKNKLYTLVHLEDLLENKIQDLGKDVPAEIVWYLCC